MLSTLLRSSSCAWRDSVIDLYEHILHDMVQDVVSRANRAPEEPCRLFNLRQQGGAQVAVRLGSLKHYQHAVFSDKSKRLT